MQDLENGGPSQGVENAGRRTCCCFL